MDYMKQRLLLIVFLFCFLLGILFSSSALAQTISLSPQSIEVEQNSNFSLTLSINSVTDLFGVPFDLNFDSSLVSFISANEGNFMSQDCATSLMVEEKTASKINIGYARLSADCGGVSGSGDLMTLNFKSLNQAGVNNFSFSNNSLCLLDDGICKYVDGLWNTANATIIATQSGDTADPSIPTNLSTASISSYAINLSWSASTDNVGVAGYKIYRDGNQIGTSASISYTDNNLWPSTSYSYNIAAYDTADNTSDQTSTVSATTQDLPPSPTPPDPSPSPSPDPDPDPEPDPDPDPEPDPDPDPDPSPDPDSAPDPSVPESGDYAPNPPAPNGHIVVKSPENDKIYLLVDGQKRWISSAEVFISYGLVSGSEATISAQELAQYPTGSDIIQPSITEGSLIRARDDFKVYIIKPPFKRHIFNPVVFNMYGHLRWEDIVEVDPEVVSSYITSDLYRSHDDYRVYGLEEVDEVQGMAVKHHFHMAAQAYEAKGFLWEQIFIVNPEERDYYQTGSNLTE